MDALRAQISPHFLFSAFNSIAALIRTRSAEAESVVEDLADLFQYMLRASRTDVSTLEEEIRAAERNLAVETARFRDRLSVEVDVTDPLQSVALQGMTIQPLVENALKHGVDQAKDDCIVTIAARRENGRLVLRVMDTGPGFDETDLDAGYEFVPEPAGTVVLRLEDGTEVKVVRRRTLDVKETLGG